MRSAVFFTGPAVSGYARDSRVTGEAPRVRPDRKCGLRNRFPASRPHQSAGYAPALAGNHADPPFGRRFRPWPSRVTTPGGPVGFRLQSPSTLEITTAKEDTRAQYIKYVQDFIRTVIGANLQIDEVSILSPDVRSEAERLIQTHKIDFLDCFQIVTILRGRFRHLGPESKSILITADHGLARAARAEGVRVWECTTESAPV